MQPSALYHLVFLFNYDVIWGYVLECCRAGSSGGWESTDSQVTGNIVLEVDVQVIVGSLAESLLHGGIISIGTRSPVGVDGVVSGYKLELEVGSSCVSQLASAQIQWLARHTVVLVHHGNLLSQLRGWNVSSRERGGSGDNVEVGVNGDDSTFLNKLSGSIVSGSGCCFELTECSGDRVESDWGFSTATFWACS